jgi:hypothetical protein
MPHQPGGGVDLKKPERCSGVVTTSIRRLRRPDNGIDPRGCGGRDDEVAAAMDQRRPRVK